MVNLFSDVHISEPSLLEQSQPIDSSHVQFTPKEVVPDLPSLHDTLHGILAQLVQLSPFLHKYLTLRYHSQAHLRQLDSSVHVTRVPSVQNVLEYIIICSNYLSGVIKGYNSERKPLLDSSLLTAEVDDILEHVSTSRMNVY
jgi:hypothetical protein